jgi:hypothetical protein
MTYTRLKRGLESDSHISIVVRVDVENKVQPKPTSQKEGKKATVELELEAPARWRGGARRSRITASGGDDPGETGPLVVQFAPDL